MKGSENSLSNLWDNIKQTILHSTEVSEGGREKKGQKIYERNNDLKLLP